MKNLDRFALIDRIGRELQSRMSFSELRTYLSQFGVDTKKPTSGVNSKWVYTKELLADAPTDTIVRIADELEIDHGYSVTPARDVVVGRFWEPNHFRLFLSHLSTFKKTVAGLQRSLRVFGISAFVAHVDIEPTTEWQDEIETALSSMDALAAILMPGFKESNWTDHEVGYAIGRGVLVIPIMRDLAPYGLIGKYQGLNGIGKTVSQVARELFDIIAASPKTKNLILSRLVDSTLQAESEHDGLDKIAVLESLKEIPIAHLERFREGALRSQRFAGSAVMVARLNELLVKHGLQKLTDLEPLGNDGSSEMDIKF